MRRSKLLLACAAVALVLVPAGRAAGSLLAAG